MMTQKNLIFCAFRYCLGRKTYVVSDMVECLIEDWCELDKSMQVKIKLEIKSAILIDRAGMDMDIKEWEKILKLK